MTHTPMGPGAEFDSIRELLGIWGPIAHGIGDDAAVLVVPAGMQLVVSTDSTVEDVHFRRKWLSAEEIGARGATAALSDIAAMGAEAQAVLVSIVLPSIWRDHLRELASGIGATVRAAGARIVGGNLSRGASFSCTFTVLGHTPAPVRRAGGMPGHLLYTTGTLGGPGAAVAAWECGREPEPWAFERFARPTARLAEGRWLAQHGAAAMIDISDGLAADGRHLATASGAVARFDLSRVPVFPGVAAADAMKSGEEYELLVALPPDDATTIEAAFRERFPVAFTQVGALEAASAGSDDAGAHEHDLGSRVEFHGGHDHFTPL